MRTSGAGRIRENGRAPEVGRTIVPDFRAAGEAALYDLPFTERG
jgi:hypothetical protein